MPLRFTEDSPLSRPIATVEELLAISKTFPHSGVLTCDGMSIIDADTFRVEAVTAVILDHTVDPANPIITEISVAQTDHTILGGGDQVVFAYITPLGVYEIRTDAPDRTTVTDEIFVGKVTMAAGVIQSTSFTPIVAYSGSVDDIVELVGLGGLMSAGSQISAAGANLTLGVTSGQHTQLGRGFLIDPNAPNQCSTPADAVVGFTGANSRMFLVHKGVTMLELDADVTGANPDIDPEQFNNGGTLAAMSNNQFQALRVVQFCDTDFIIVYYGTVEYSTLSGAKAGYLTEDFEASNESKDGSLIAAILVKKGVTNLTTAIAGGDAEIINRAGARDPKG